MEITINLINDWKNKILLKINELKTIGFTFIEYDDWKAQKIVDYKNRINTLKKEKKNFANVEKLLEEKSLKNKFKSELIITYHNLLYKIPESIPRKVKYSRDFKCPTYLRKGLDNLEKKIKNGESLYPHVSRGIQASTMQDGMLFDWGIYHLHLGIEPHKDKPYLVETTAEILYLTFYKDIAFFLCIDNHGKWADLDLLKIIKNDFPEILENSKFENIHNPEQNITESERISIRKAGGSTSTSIDGDLYFSPGGGINTAGRSTKATMNYIQSAIIWEQIQKKIIEIINEKRSEIEKNIGISISKMHIKLLSFENENIELIDTENEIKIDIIMETDWRNIKNITFDK